MEQASFSDQQYLREAKQKGVIIEEKEIYFSDVKKELNKGNILLLRLNTKPLRNEKRNTSNYIVVHGYSENYCHLIDPKIGGISVNEEILKKAFKTLGTKKHRDHRMIIFEKVEKDKKED